GVAWIKLQSAKSGWSLSGNTGINDATQFIGTTDNKILRFRVNNLNAGLIDHNNKNVLFGTNAGTNLAVGSNGNFIAGDSAHYASNSQLIGNTVIGFSAQ
ncbi:hypothetical protein, partial [Rhizobium leguminosarum]|uniref:hypothetical protein n=1 Tax=Rhizobium leguminosarum TaxID=384 RepID=UPI003F9668B0